MDCQGPSYRNRQFKEQAVALEDFPLVEAVVTNVRADLGCTSDEALKCVRRDFDTAGPYETAKRNGVLVNNSGEEFAIQFMTLINSRQPGTY